MTIYISELNVFPVKSLAGFSLQSTYLGYTGLKHDRNWMAVKPDGTFLTQRTHPQMAQVETRIVNDQLVLDCFGMESFTAPLTSADMERLPTAVWGDPVHGIDLGDDTATWLSQAIGEQCRILGFPANEPRPCNPAVSKQGDNTQFADGFPLLIVSEASLEELNDRLSQPVSMKRFRPNIVVSGCDAFAEDNWQQIRINGITIRIAEPCARCSVPTIDPDTGTLQGPEPIHTLSSYRERNGEVYFGVNAIPDGEGEIGVRDSVEVTC